MTGLPVAVARWYNPAVTLYSRAPRCQPCDMKAALDEPGAQALANVSADRLACYPCPVGGGWHVRRTDIRHPRLRRPRVSDS